METVTLSSALCLYVEVASEPLTNFEVSCPIAQEIVFESGFTQVLPLLSAIDMEDTDE
jgi:hypothetical protein